MVYLLRMVYIDDAVVYDEFVENNFGEKKINKIEIIAREIISYRFFFFLTKIHRLFLFLRRKHVGFFFLFARLFCEITFFYARATTNNNRGARGRNVVFESDTRTRNA